MSPLWMLHWDLRAQGFKSVNFQAELCTKTGSMQEHRDGSVKASGLSGFWLSN